MRGLRGKRILVAGSATGIGQATARRLGEEGAHLVLADINITGARSVAKDITDAGGKAGAIHFDLGDRESIKSMVAQAAGDLGGLDGVANVAADLSPANLDHDKPVLEMDPDVWEHTLRVNLIGVALITKHILPHLFDAGGGSIVNVSSESTRAPVRPAYGASKAGIEALTRHTARNYADKNVRANVASPGFVPPPGDTGARVSPAERERHAGGVYLPRVGKPTDLGQTISFLLSDDAEWVTGQVWSVNGGGGFRG
jgi:NAD(P)-dependent dehydrogenase (short-subunit alcohol dehydrogenase family)